MLTGDAGFTFFLLAVLPFGTLAEAGTFAGRFALDNLAEEDPFASPFALGPMAFLGRVEIRFLLAAPNLPFDGY